MENASLGFLILGSWVRIPPGTPMMSIGTRNSNVATVCSRSRRDSLAPVGRVNSRYAVRYVSLHRNGSDGYLSEGVRSPRRGRQAELVATTKAAKAA